jgi:DNA modification methylase
MEADTIYCGDALKLLPKWPAGVIDLVFADPPYNIGYVYDQYRDDLPDQQYVAWCRDWMAACQRVLTDTGSFYIAIGDDFAAQVRLLGRELGLHLRNWIIWHYTFGQSMKSKFCRSHTHIFYFTKHPQDFTFNDRALRFPSARHTEYQDLRANPLGRLPDDVWDEFPRVCGTFKERDGFHGCQMPEALLMRIVLASSNPGDVALDPFVGSGTTVVAAKRLGRRYVGIDISPEYVRRTQERLRRVRDESALQADDGRWPGLHIDLLMQLYRETKVTLENLLPNEVALRVIANALNARTGAAYDADAIRERLLELRATSRLPKLPNDTPFTRRNHVTSEGKRYQRRVLRWHGRKTSASAKASRRARVS